MKTQKSMVQMGLNLLGREIVVTSGNRFSIVTTPRREFVEVVGGTWGDDWGLRRLEAWGQGWRGRRGQRLRMRVSVEGIIETFRLEGCESGKERCQLVLDGNRGTSLSLECLPIRISNQTNKRQLSGGGDPLGSLVQREFCSVTKNLNFRSK